MKKRIHPDLIIGAVLIVCSLVFFYLSYGFRNQDAATWPRAILIFIMILSAVLVLKGISLTRAAQTENVKSTDFTGPAVGLVLVIIYAVLMNFTGFFVSTALFLPVGMFLLGQRNWKVILGVTVGLEVFVYLLFVVGLQLRMP